MPEPKPGFDRGREPEPAKKPEKPRKRPYPRPGSTVSTGGNYIGTRADRVNPDIAGGPDHGGPH